jgi:acrylyl-CoA reductase (NADPH)
MVTMRALVAHQDAAGSVTLKPEMVEDTFLPGGEVTISVEYSSVNYKDALAVDPKGGVARQYPLIPGIDVAGTVVASGSADFAAGDRVFAHGYDVGTGRHGGYAEFARYPADYLVKLGSVSTARAAAIGTAGFTAAMSVGALRAHGVQPHDGPVLVTGATGGVGSVSVDLLAGLGYEVIASTGKTDAHDYLISIGASNVVPRLPGEGETTRPLGKSAWAAVVDSVGGDTLAYALSTLQYRGIAAISGLARSPALATTVMPFILRGVTMAGMDSVQLPIADRRDIWRNIETHLAPRHLDIIASDLSVLEVPETLRTVIGGGVRGRTRVKVRGGF